MAVIAIAICDDNPAWLQEASRRLELYARDAGIEISLATYGSPTELLLAECQPDALFCDIELGGERNGIDLVRALAARWPLCQIVYVTNFLRYAPDTYVTEHLWFVLKEHFSERLPEVMEKLQRKMDDDGRVLTVQTTDHDLVTLPCTLLVSLERSMRVTILRTTDGSAYEVPDRLQVLLERLPARSFARCHASIAVALGQVRLVRKSSVVMNDGSELPISRRYAREFRERFLDWADDHAV